MAPRIPVSLTTAAEAVKKDGFHCTTVRALLAWFYAERRGRLVVHEIRRALSELELKTDPDFEGIHIDDTISLRSVHDARAESTEKEIEENSEATDSTNLSSTGRYQDPTYNIGKLDSAVSAPVSVSPDTKIIQAVTTMMVNDFSQLPVMVGDRDVKGMFSWKQLGTFMTIGRKCDTVGECMGRYQVVESNVSIFSALPLVAEHECVLVRNVNDRKISGIVTASDFAAQFGQMGEPFLLLGEIENHVRNLLDGKISQDDLETVKDPNDPDREINDVSDLTFGEYVRLIENPKTWEKLAIPLDRAVFSKRIDEVRQIRNDVMHFDPDGLSETDLETLRQTRKFLESVGGLVQGHVPN